MGSGRRVDKRVPRGSGVSARSEGKNQDLQGLIGDYQLTNTRQTTKGITTIAEIDPEKRRVQFFSVIFLKRIWIIIARISHKRTAPGSTIDRLVITVGIIALFA
jgi:hypothetical protein